MADFLPTLTMAAKNLAVEMTNFNVEEKDLQGELPPSEDIRKLERRVKTQERKIVEQSGKLDVADER